MFPFLFFSFFSLALPPDKPRLLFNIAGAIFLSSLPLTEAVAILWAVFSCTFSLVDFRLPSSTQITAEWLAGPVRGSGWVTATHPFFTLGGAGVLAPP